MARKKLAQIIGINQLTDETGLSDGDTRDPKMFVREATNVDIDAEGNVGRRKGATLLTAGSGYHSLYNATRKWMLLCYKNQLGVYTPSTATFTALATMNDAYYTSFAEIEGNLYAMNPSFSCMFLPDSTVAKPLGVPLPNVDVEFYVSSAGDFEEGKYGVAYSLVDPDGEESGISKVITLELEAGQGIGGTMFTVLSGYKYRVYTTTANGEDLRQAAEFDADSITYEILTPEEGRSAETFGLEPPPKGHFLRSFNSRLLIGTTGYVYFTEAFRPHLWDPRNYVMISGWATMIEPVDEGVFIGDKNGVRFYKGQDPTEWQAMDASPEVAIYGTSETVSGAFFGGELADFDEVAVWLTPKGYLVGTPTGEVLRLNADQVRIPMYSRGKSVVRTADGRKQLITAVNSNLSTDVGVALDSTTI